MKKADSVSKADQFKNKQRHFNLILKSAQTNRYTAEYIPHDWLAFLIPLSLIVEGWL